MQLLDVESINGLIIMYAQTVHQDVLIAKIQPCSLIPAIQLLAQLVHGISL